MTDLSVAIIGAGQLGTRHMQSVASDCPAAHIWMVDPSPVGRVLVSERLKEIGKSEASVSYCETVRALPERIDVAVIATSSEPRLSALRHLLKGRSMGAIILEKFLFPRVSDYRDAHEALARTGAPAFVNCPRRQFPGYRAIKNEIGRQTAIVVEGGRWGLACNSIHWFDLFDFLAPGEGRRVRSRLSNPVPAKRDGYIEFFGEIEIDDADGNRLCLICHDDARPTEVRIEDGSGRCWMILEGKRCMTTNAGTAEFPFLFQSQLTAAVVGDLVRTGGCELTPFEDSANLHLLLLEQFLSANHKGQSPISDFCPIT